MKITLSNKIAILGIIISIALAMLYRNAESRNKQLQDNRQELHNQAQIVYQYVTTNNYNVPKEVIDAVKLITTGTAPNTEVIESPNNVK